MTLIISAYETEELFHSNECETSETNCEMEASRLHNEFEALGYWLVTTTDENGKLKR